MMIYGSQLRRISGPELEPVTLEEAKRQCRIDADLTEEEDDIQSWITVARELAEDYCKATFCETTWEMRLNSFPASVWTASPVLELPMGPVLEVLSVEYLDIQGNLQTIDLSTLQHGVDAQPPYLLPAVGECWPPVTYGVGAVVVRYRAGFPGTGSPEGADGVPARAKHAIKMMVGHFYENREAISSETRQIPTAIPYGFERLLDSLRRYP